jgi:hypothetical protein
MRGKKKNSSPFIYYFLFIICTALLAAGCDNAHAVKQLYAPDADIPDWWLEQWEELEDEDDDIPVSVKKQVSVDAEPGLTYGNGGTATAGTTVVRLTLPPAFDVDLPDTEDNALFELANETGDTGTVRVVIKEEGDSLELGSYIVVILITPPADSGELPFYIKREFTVSKTPPPLKKAPAVYPYIIAPGKNKLKVSWDERPAGTTGYKLYIGTSADTAAAKPIGEPVTESGSEHTKEITEIPDYGIENGLPDGTTYYVWVRAYNDDGDGGFGPPGVQTTSATMPDMLWMDEDDVTFTSWDSFYGGDGSVGGTDFYIIRPPSADHPGGTLRYGPLIKESNGIIAGGGWKGDIVHYIKEHRGGRGKWGEDASGWAGVFIFRYHEDSVQPFPPDNIYGGEHRPYYAVYYSGLGAIQTVGPPTNTFGPNNDARGLLMCYFGNAYDVNGVFGVGIHQNPQRPTHEEAIDRFSMANVNHFIAGVAIPWYRKYGPYNLDRDPVGIW